MPAVYVPTKKTVGHWAMWGDFTGQLAASIFWVFAVVVYNEYTADMLFQLLAALSWLTACMFQLYVRLGYAHEGLRNVEEARTEAWAVVRGKPPKYGGVPLQNVSAAPQFTLRL
jgi:hypothetical protein